MHDRVKIGTNSYRFIRYIEPAIGRVKYYTWPGGTVPPVEGAWAMNRPAPPIEHIDTMFCAAVGNLLMRLIGKRIPIAQLQAKQYDGGIAAYFGSPILPAIGAGYFSAFTEDFDADRALAIARATGQIVMIGKPYKGVDLPFQGHLAFVLPSGFVLQSDKFRGLNWERTVHQSHADIGYTLMVHPKFTHEYVGDEVHKGGVLRRGAIPDERLSI